MKTTLTKLLLAAAIGGVVAGSTFKPVFGSTQCFYEGWRAELAWRYDLVTDTETQLIELYEASLVYAYPTCGGDDSRAMDYEGGFIIWLKANSDTVAEHTGRTVKRDGQLSKREER